jgi:hypothetical protein
MAERIQPAQESRVTIREAQSFSLPDHYEQSFGTGDSGIDQVALQQQATGITASRRLVACGTGPATILICSGHILSL